MKFTLHYRGPLRSAGNPRHKHDLRRKFHEQLQRVWREEPLAREDCQKLLRPPARPGDFSCIRVLGPFAFAPLAMEQMKVLVSLNIVMLRCGPPGKIITHGGDIDNCLKTLFDALSMPPHANALPSDAVPGTDESPFFCLLEDDKLVNEVAVRTDQLFEAVADPAEVDLTVGVRIDATMRLWGNWMF